MKLGRERIPLNALSGLAQASVVDSHPDVTTWAPGQGTLDKWGGTSKWDPIWNGRREGNRRANLYVGRHWSR